jgi:hypothetical protein
MSKKTVTKMPAKKTTVAKKPAAKHKAPGLLPSPRWLKANGYGGLVRAMRKHPDAFAHIKQQADAGNFNAGRKALPESK